MWFITIIYKQQIDCVFKFLIWKVNWKSQTIFVTKHVNANVVFCFNLAKIFFSHKKLNFILIEILSKFFTFTHNSFWMYFCGINMPNMHHKNIFDPYFWCWLAHFLDFLILQALSHKNSLIMVGKLKCYCIETRLIQQSNQILH